MPVCPVCFTDTPDPNAWRAHMTSDHGGFTDEQKFQAGILEDGENARTALGDENLDDVPETTPPKTPRPITAVPRSASARGKVRREPSAIGRILVRRLGTMPYTTWAALMNDKRFALQPDEQKELTEMYLEIVQGMDVDFSSPKWAFLAALSVNADFVLVRLSYMGFAVPVEDEVEQPQ